MCMQVGNAEFWKGHWGAEGKPLELLTCLPQSWQGSPAHFTTVDRVTPLPPSDRFLTPRVVQFLCFFPGENLALVGTPRLRGLLPAMPSPPPHPVLAHKST